MDNSRVHKGLFILLLILLIATVVIALTKGAASIELSIVVKTLINGPANDTTSRIIWQHRFPRVLTSVVAGAILAVSGMVYQALFRNPMADPYVLGISSGGAFGVSIAAYFGLLGAAGGIWKIPIAAFVGAFGSATLILLLANRSRGNQTTLLLFGVALNFLLSALMTLFMFLNRSQLQSILQWSMGSFATASWQKVAIITSIAIFSLIPILFFTRELDILLTDESSALSMGVEINKVRTILLLFTTLATSVTVSFCGVIGFVGLMVPHIMRLIVGPRHKRLFIFSLVGGALITLLSDTIARLIVAPSELPVGIITSIAGSPLFFFLVFNSRKRSSV
jgi:iron complex transport system permease protein